VTEYEGLCRRHYMRRMTSQAARSAAVSLEMLPLTRTSVRSSGRLSDPAGPSAGQSGRAPNMMSSHEGTEARPPLRAPLSGTSAFSAASAWPAGSGAGACD